MNILDDNKEICGKNLKDSDFVFSCEGNCGLVLEGNYKIEGFNKEEIVLKLSKNSFMKIEGENLEIGTLAPHEIGIIGSIFKIEFIGDKK